MKFVKLTAKPNTWFKAGTEVYDYDSMWVEQRMVTLDHWNACKNEGNGICVRGIRICEEGNGEVENLGYKVGEERIDGEYCSCDEFDVEIVEI